MKYFYLLFTVFFMITSLILCEFSSVYLSEIKETSHYVGSIPLLMLTYYVFFTVLNYGDGLFEKNNNQTINTDEITSQKSKSAINYLCFIADIAFLYLFISVFNTPSFIIGVDRFTYSMFYLNNYSKMFRFLNNYAQLIMIPCILAIIYGKKVLGIVGLILYSLFMFWIGNKSGPFVSMISVFFMISSRKNAKDNKKKSNTMVMILIVLALVLLCYFALSFTVDNGDVKQVFANRFAAQGQLWWKTYKLTNGEAHYSQLINEFSGVFEGSSSIVENVGANYGIYHIMYLCAPKNIVDAKLLTGSRYTEAGYATSFYCLGFIGPILFSIIAAISISYIENNFIKSIYTNQIFKAAIILRFFFLATTTLSMGVYSSYFDKVSLVSYAYLFLTYRRRLRLNKTTKSNIGQIGLN